MTKLQTLVHPKRRLRNGSIISEDVKDLPYYTPSSTIITVPTLVTHTPLEPETVFSIVGVSVGVSSDVLSGWKVR